MNPISALVASLTLWALTATAAAVILYRERKETEEINGSTRWLMEHAQATIESASRLRSLFETELADRLASDNGMKELIRQVDKLDKTTGHLAGKIMLSTASRSPMIGEESREKEQAMSLRRRIPSPPGSPMPSGFPPPSGFQDNPEYESESEPAS